jgi:hypothetical protein
MAVRALLTVLVMLLVSPARADDHATLLTRAIDIVQKKLNNEDCEKYLNTLPDKVSLTRVRHKFTIPPVNNPWDRAGWVYCRSGQRDTIFYNEGWVTFHDSAGWLAHVMLHEYVHLRSCSIIEHSDLNMEEIQSISYGAERVCLGHLRSDAYGVESERH